MPQNVGQRLLGDAIAHELGLGAQVGQAAINAGVDARAGLFGEPVGQQRERRRKTKVVEGLGSQALRDLPHVLQARAGVLASLCHLTS